MNEVKITYCNVDRLFYISRGGEEIHSQTTKPTDTDIIEALSSDSWKMRFDDMREGKTVRVSDRIYYSMLESVPPAKYTSNGFYCGEAYSGNLYYYFYRDENDGKRYGKLKPIKSEAASKVLRLMDNDYSYTEALTKTLSEDSTISREFLEQELNQYI